MSKPSVTETVIVDFKYEKNNSFKATNGSWFRVSDYAKSSTGDKLGLNDFEKGKQYAVTVQTGPKGGKYVVSAVASEGSVPETFNKNMGGEDAKTAKPAKKYVPSSETMSKAEWADKDARISMQGLYQAALQAAASSGAATTFEEFHDLAWGDASHTFKKLWGRDFVTKGE